MLYPMYSKLGNLTVVPAADLVSLTSAANVRGDARVGSDGIGKTAGMIVVRDAGGGVYSLVMALGGLPADKWQVVDGSVQYTPV